MRHFLGTMAISAGFAILPISCDHEQPVPVITPPDPHYTCVWNGTDKLSSLDSISCPEEFEALAGAPIVQTLSDVRSVKVVYEIATQRLYFVAADSFRLHFDFCGKVLGFPGYPATESHRRFNDEQYGDSPNRLYYLASIDYFRGADVFALRFFADDRVTAEGIHTTFFMAKQGCYFGDRLRFLAGSTTLSAQAAQLGDVPQVTEDELYGGQEFQALNSAEAYGYLRKVDITAVETARLGRHDIVVVNGLPIGIPVIAGIITTVFQTPLSHVNVLSHNRGTPNMALKTAWEDTLFAPLWDKLVYFRVTADSFMIREALPAEADSFWNSREAKVPITLVCHDDTAGIFSLAQLSLQSLNLVGAKAANLAQVAKMSFGNESIPVPEGAFAIPFYYYRRHMADNGIDEDLDELLNDGRFATDAAYRAEALEKFRERIIDAPLDDAFVDSVEAKIRTLSPFTSIRFRSSTNVEDIEGFNGAGLYESHTTELGNADKTVAEAIKKVYASLWTLRGFEERDYFKIDQRSCAMGILVHRAFFDEQANGVAITANIYQPYVPAYTVNVQIKDISVVMPPAGFLSDQFLFHTWREDWRDRPTVEYIAHSNVNHGDPVLNIEETVRLAEYLERIKNTFCDLKYGAACVLEYYTFAMDVEFKFDGPERKLYIKQARPYKIGGGLQ